MPSGGRHGNLSARASRIYEAIRRDNPSYSKTKAAKIANASVAGTIDHRRGGGRSGGFGGKMRRATATATKTGRRRR